MNRLINLLAAVLLLLSSCTGKPGFKDTTTTLPVGGYTCYAVYPGAGDAVDTKAPKGYKPFYISHYGRHGSRYVNGLNMLPDVLKVLSEASEADQLTREGVELYEVLQDVNRKSEGRIGLITPLGARELEGIGCRIAARYPKVFKGRDSVCCIVSTYQRCMLSMICYNDQIKAEYPHLKFGYDQGGPIQSIINNTEGMDAITSVNQPAIDGHFEQNFGFNAFAKKIFKDPSFFKGDAHRFVRNLYLDGADLPCMGEDSDRIFRFFSKRQLQVAWADYNMHLYLNHCHSAATGNRRQAIQTSLVQDIIDKADRAIAGNDRAMDVRFGHDGALMSLCSYLGLAGYDVCVGADEVNSVWSSDVMMPMASNLHLVFYRSGKSPVLAKLLFNERETAIPSLGEGPYYEWTAVKDFLLGRIEEFSK